MNGEPFCNDWRNNPLLPSTRPPFLVNAYSTRSERQRKEYLLVMKVKSMCNAPFYFESHSVSPTTTRGCLSSAGKTVNWAMGSHRKWSSRFQRKRAPFFCSLCMLSWYPSSLDGDVNLWTKIVDFLLVPFFWKRNSDFGTKYILENYINSHLRHTCWSNKL